MKLTGTYPRGETTYRGCWSFLAATKFRCEIDLPDHFAGSILSLEHEHLLCHPVVLSHLFFPAVSRHFPEDALSPEFAVEFWIDAITTEIGIETFAALLTKSSFVLLADCNRLSIRVIPAFHAPISMNSRLTKFSTQSFDISLTALLLYNKMNGPKLKEIQKRHVIGAPIKPFRC